MRSNRRGQNKRSKSEDPQKAIIKSLFLLFFFSVFVRKHLPNYHANKLNPKKVKASYKSLPYISYILPSTDPTNKFLRIQIKANWP